MKKIRIIFYVLFTLYLIFSNFSSSANSYQYLCKEDDNRIWLKFDKNKQLVFINNQTPHKYFVKEGITYWSALNEILKNNIIVNTFLFQKSSGKLAVDSHSLISDYNKKYFMICDELL